MKTFLNNKWALSVSSGILLGLSFLPFDLSFLSFPAFVLLFHLVELSESKKQLAYYSYAGFVVWNVIATYWLVMATVAGGIAAILANSLLMVIPLCFAHYFAKKIKSPILTALLQATAWLSYEFLHHHWDLSWPWLAIGNAWANHISLVQYISVTGYLGITFWVVFTSALAYQTIRFNTKRLAIATIISLLVLPTISLLMFAARLDFNTSSVPVTVIQPNHDSYLDYGGMSGNVEALDSLFALTSRTRTADSKLVVWPENAIDKPIQMNSYTARRIADSARAWQSGFIVGSGLITLYDEENKPELYHGYHFNRPYNVFNSSLFVDENGQLSQYDKANLVPIVERMPFVNFFNKIDIFRWFNWGNLAGFGKGKTPDMLETENYKSPGLVCYDSVYPSWTREFVKNGANFITIITNDGWWGNTSGHLQHFAYARLRAIEFDRYIVRSANNGISGIIAADGEVKIKTNYWEKTGFNFRVPQKNTTTFYTRFGDWLPILCLIITVSGLVIVLIRPKN